MVNELIEGSEGLQKTNGFEIDICYLYCWNEVSGLKNFWGLEFYVKKVLSFQIVQTNASFFSWFELWLSMLCALCTHYDD